MVGTKEKICTICVFCGGEPDESCFHEHDNMIKDVYPENILTKEEMKELNELNM